MEDRLTAERLRALFAYEPETGIFTRKVARGNARAGDIARGTPVKDGYLMMSVDGRLYLQHRLAWLYMTGEWPEGVVDHRDGTVTHNAFHNLRDVTHAVNMQNQRKARGDNLLGLMGVKRDRQGMFVAQIRVDGRLVSLGRYPTPDEAHTAYCAAKRQYHAGCTI